MLTEPTLLVVDDEDAICEGCRRIFSRQGFDVVKCNDASQGLDLAKHGDYTAILLDIKMPEHGRPPFPRSPAQREARRAGRPDDRAIPSIPNAASAIRLGASDYVTKPFTPEEISQAVHRCCTSARARPRRPASPAARVTRHRERPFLLPRCLVSG